jgi:FtsH-binding integral membrane protein
MNEYTTSFGNSAAEAAPSQRAQFIRRTYTLLAVAILAFIVVETFLFATGVAHQIAAVIFTGGGMGWLLVLGLFMGVSILADRWASSETSIVTQYLGLGIAVLAWSVVFVPLLYYAVHIASDDTVLIKAGVTSLGLFLGLTATVFITRSDFSFLGPIVAIGGFAALGLIVSSILFGFNLGNLFAFAMVAFAGTAILYNTSQVLHKYNTNQHVAAALTLFAGILLLFWYILRIFSSRD